MTSKEIDFNSSFGISTKIWGPILWQFLHIISVNYPVKPTDKDKKNYYDFIMSLQHVLPCSECRMNLPNNLKMAKFGMDKLKDRKTFSKFIYDLHNIINQMLNKKPYLTFEDIRKRYEHFRASCTPSKPKPKSENGCVLPINKIKSRTIVQIVPLTKSRESFSMDKRCLPVKTKSSKKSKK